MTNLFGPLLAEEVPAGRVSLCFSVATYLRRFGLVAIVLVAGGYLLGWWFPALLLGLLVVGSLWLLDRRIDVDRAGLSFVPLLPIRPVQRLAFADIGPFQRRERVWSRSARAPVSSGGGYRLGGVFPRRYVDVGGAYGFASYWAPALSMLELLSLLERFRLAAVT